MKKYTKTKIDRAWFSRLVRHPAWKTERVYSYNRGGRTGDRTSAETSVSRSIVKKWAQRSNCDALAHTLTTVNNMQQQPNVAMMSCEYL